MCDYHTHSLKINEISSSKEWTRPSDFKGPNPQNIPLRSSEQRLISILAGTEWKLANRDPTPNRTKAQLSTAGTDNKRRESTQFVAAIFIWPTTDPFTLI